MWPFVSVRHLLSLEPRPHKGELNLGRRHKCGEEELEALVFHRLVLFHTCDQIRGCPWMASCPSTPATVCCRCSAAPRNPETPHCQGSVIRQTCLRHDSLARMGPTAQAHPPGRPPARAQGRAGQSEGPIGAAAVENPTPIPLSETRLGRPPGSRDKWSYYWSTHLSALLQAS